MKAVARLAVRAWACVIACVPLVVGAASPPRLVYVKRDTREATRAATVAATTQRLAKLVQGPWYVRETSAFTLPPGGVIDVEQENARTPDRPTWTRLEGFSDGTEHAFPTRVVLYRTITSDRATVATIRFRVDRGVTFDLNGVRGHMTVTTYIPPLEDLRIPIALERGTNHLAVELGWMGGSPIRFLYELQAMPLALETELAERLERDFPRDAEPQHYRIETIAVPSGAVLEVGGMAFVPDPARPSEDVLLVATRRGEIWRRARGRWSRVAEGLAEPLGLWAERADEIYVAQRTELTRLRDLDRDGTADVYETAATGWDVSGGHHEYVFGLVRDDERAFFVTTCALGDASRARYLGWALRLGADGTLTPWASGLRCPNGLARSPQGDLFVIDNQGEYVPTSVIHHLERGAFYGHPTALAWDDRFGGRQASQIPLETLDAARKKPAIVMPYGPMGQSPTQPVFDTTGGKFGPFTEQMFVGDQTTSAVYRIALERVDGVMQGAAFPFRAGFQSGNNRAAFARDGSLWVGQTDRGWGAIGGREFGLQRLVWTGKTPFEIERMRVRPNGFELTFTGEVDVASASRASAYALQHFHYPYSRTYGVSPQGHTPVPVERVEVSDDRRRVSLQLGGLVPGRLYQLRADGVRSAAGAPLLHPIGYYTLNRVPR